MASYFPLIVDAGSAQIQELPSGDTLNLASSNVANVINITATGDVSCANLSISATFTAASLSATGNVTGGNVTTAGIITVNSGNAVSAIVNGGGNGVGNIGSSSKYFNTAFVKSTSAQYADLAEMYTADADYAPGTVLAFGGTHEVTISTKSADTRVAGVVSANPSYVMNATLLGDHVVTLALMGRVPTRVTGSVRKGDMMVSAGDGTARSEPSPRVGTVIGKAVEDFEGDSGVIEVVVGRL